MAIYPCLRDQQRFQGEAMNLYLTVYFGDERESYRFVVCPSCAEQLAEEWRENALRRGEDDDWQLPQPGTPPVRLQATGEPQERAPRRRNGRR